MASRAVPPHHHMADPIELVALTAQGNAEVEAEILLRQALGFDLENDEHDFRAYLSYVKIYWPGNETEDHFLRLFADIVTFLRGLAGEERPTIQSHIDYLVGDRHHFYFKTTPAFSDVREMVVKDTVLLILGLWTLTRSYFVPLHGREAHILQICSKQPPQNTLQQPPRDTIQQPRQSALQQSVYDIISKSGILPNPDEEPAVRLDTRSTQQDLEGGGLISTPPFSPHSAIDLVGSLSIPTKKLNLFKLKVLADVQILWTDNVSRHMLLSRRGQEWYIELFALPCAMQGGACDVLRDAVGIPAGLMYEIELSYANLFNPVPPSKTHRYAGMLLALPLWCWCVSCSSARLRRRHLAAGTKEEELPRWDQARLPDDPRLKEVTNREPVVWWDRTSFENLWPRIQALDQCLQGAKPWSFWVLLRDNRNTVQYWTFLFGTIVLVLTVMQVVLGLLQVTQG
ncbi:hypothetical protein DL764_000699 [Monosporascus ibericus]|uniref:Uncharacterized protein n=1 Tax=Monosporascus ibericus TaxID=155417 RepID=A0A4Q4TSF4_9PEZI|nr:hypothetical protein DL764_000699 [Monosporascus ibericus]